MKPAKYWNIKYYESNRGDKPIQKFIDEQEEKARVKIVKILELLEEFGTQIGAPHAKKLTGTPLWELRILGENNTRIFYFLYVKHTFLILHAFKKKTQKTDKRDIKIALSRLKEVHSR